MKMNIARDKYLLCFYVMQVVSLMPYEYEIKMQGRARGLNLDQL